MLAFDVNKSIELVQLSVDASKESLIESVYRSADSLIRHFFALNCVNRSAYHHLLAFSRPPGGFWARSCYQYPTLQV